MNISDVVEISPSALSGSRPPLDSYDSVSENWEETEFRIDAGNTAVEAGYWAGELGSVAFNEWPYTELCVILKGRVAVEDAAGERKEYGAGQSFLIRQGFAGIWHTLESTEKVFVGVHGEKD